MPAIKIKRKQFDKLQGGLSDADFAAIVGVDKTLLWKIKADQSNPGSQFVSRVLAKYPKVKFDDIPGTKIQIYEDGKLIDTYTPQKSGRFDAELKYDKKLEMVFV